MTVVRPVAVAAALGVLGAVAAGAVGASAPGQTLAPARGPSPARTPAGARGPAAIGPSTLRPTAVRHAAIAPTALAPAGVDAPVPSPAAPTGSTPAGHPPPASGWTAPVLPLHLARPFLAPAERWSVGHRGVDLVAPGASPVQAPSAGVVAFVGMVAGRPVLSLDHPGGLRTTYEPLVSALAVGDRVSRGQQVGRVLDDSHCPGGCLHWGARRGEVYVDPLSLLADSRVILLPLRD